MLKKLIYIILLMFPIIGYCGNINYVKEQNYSYIIYNKYNREITSISVYDGRLMGYSSNYIILMRNGYYVFYNDNGKKFMSLLVNNIGDIVKISDDYFIHLKDPYLKNYNIKTKKDIVINYI